MKTLKVDLKNFQNASNFYRFIMQTKGEVKSNNRDIKDIQIYNSMDFSEPIEVTFYSDEDYETYKCSCSK